MNAEKQFKKNMKFVALFITQLTDEEMRALADLLSSEINERFTERLTESYNGEP